MLGTALIHHTTPHTNGSGILIMAAVFALFFIWLWNKIGKRRK